MQEVYTVISRDRLNLCGKFIHYYRREALNKSLNSYRMTQKGFCEGICSINTLSSIEQGNISRYLDVYKRLLAKFDFKLVQDPIVDKALEELWSKLYNAIEYYNVKEANVLFDKATKLLSDLKDVIYYAQIYEIIGHIKHFYNNQVMMNEEEQFFYIKLIDLYPEYLREIVKEICYRVSLNRYYSRDIENEIYEKLKIEESSAIFLQISSIYHYIREKRMVRVINIQSRLRPLLLQQNNTKAIYQMNNAYIVMLFYNDPKALDEVIAENEQIMKDYDLDICLLGDYYYVIGMAMLEKKEYVIAKEYLYQIALHGLNPIPAAVYTWNCCRRLEEPLIDIPFDPEHKGIYSKSQVKAYAYFVLLRQGESEERLQDFIMKEVLPYIQLSDIQLVDVLKYELNECVKVTNRYKDFFIFEQAAKKALEL